MMATKQQVIDLHVKHPDWTSYRIAEELDCTAAYVRATGSRNGLKFPRGVKAKNGDVYDLGLACMAIGLTLRDILDIGARKKARA